VFLPFAEKYFRVRFSFNFQFLKKQLVKMLTLKPFPGRIRPGCQSPVV
jgi:hypothetical protein